MSTTSNADRTAEAQATDDYIHAGESGRTDAVRARCNPSTARRCALAAWRYDEVIGGTSDHKCECGSSTSVLLVQHPEPELDVQHHAIVICDRTGSDL